MNCNKWIKNINNNINIAVLITATMWKKGTPHQNIYDVYAKLMANCACGENYEKNSRCISFNVCVAHTALSLC